MQGYWINHGDVSHHVSFPPADAEVVPGICWGRAEMLDTAAYWALRCLVEKDPLRGFTSANGSLVSEIGFCLLGGFGITAELNSAAFARLGSAHVFDLDATISETFVRNLLAEPLEVGGRRHRYRFPNQRAGRLVAMRERLLGVELEGMPQIEVHAILRDIPGIGPKTAAWIMRNHFDSDEVAILDVHVLRACARLGLFPERVVLPRDYAHFERRFLDFADALQVRPSILDAVMWSDMRSERKSARPLAA